MDRPKKTSIRPARVIPKNISQPIPQKTNTVSTGLLAPNK